MNRLVQMMAAPALAMLLLCGCTQDKQQPEVRPLEKISFCQGGHIALLTQTALEQGYFAEEEIEAVLLQMGDGKTAMETFLADDCAFGVMGEPPVVKQSFDRKDFVIIASLAHSTNFTKILARKDRGINTAKDLKGKRIGVKKGVNSHTFADLYLKKHGIRLDQVTLQFMEIKDMPSALMTGDIDAYSSSTVYFLEGKRLLGDRAQALSEPDFYLANSYLIVKRDFFVAKQDLVRRVLRALYKAELRVANNPDETKKMIVQQWKVSEIDAGILLKDEKHILTLGPQQLDSLDMHALWMLEVGTVKNKPIPDFKQLLETAPLAAVKRIAADSGK